MSAGDIILMGVPSAADASMLCTPHACTAGQPESPLSSGCLFGTSVLGQILSDPSN